MAASMELVDNSETMKYYAVAKGRDIGIFHLKQKEFADVVKPLVNRFPRNIHECFMTESEAVEFMKSNNVISTYKLFDYGLNVLKTYNLMTVQLTAQRGGLMTKLNRTHYAPLVANQSYLTTPIQSVANAINGST